MDKDKIAKQVQAEAMAKVIEKINNAKQASLEKGTLIKK